MTRVHVLAFVSDKRPAPESAHPDNSGALQVDQCVKFTVASQSNQGEEMSADDSFQDDTVTLSLTRGPLTSLINHGSPSISPLEQEVLDEYTRLLGNMNRVGSFHGCAHADF